MTTEEFKAITGEDPVDDDLERANCKRAGTIGHQCCGVCEKCGWPRSTVCKCRRDAFQAPLKGNETRVLFLGMDSGTGRN